jgi:AraC family transcriptional activator of mtrCDE
MPATIDWLSRLLDLLPVAGRLDVRCFYGAPWRIAYERSDAGTIPYHIVVAGSAWLDDPSGGPRKQLRAGDIVVMLDGGAHVLHDGSGAKPVRAQKRDSASVVISENAGTGERLDMMCGSFVLTPQHDRLLRDYLPTRLAVSAASHSASTARPGTAAQLAGLVELMRTESASENLGGRAMLNALSTAMFALVLRLASESHDPPAGLLALAGHPRLAPALAALFHEPARAWTLPELARLCNMSRATLVRQFQERLGRSPTELLADIRMTLAANELKKPSANTAAVAAAVGYQSEAAFQRAFKQRMQITPAQWRRTARGDGER